MWAGERGRRVRALHSGLYDRCGGFAGRESGAAGVCATWLPVYWVYVVYFDVKEATAVSSSIRRLTYRPGNLSKSRISGITTGEPNSPFAQRGAYWLILSFVASLVSLDVIFGFMRFIQAASSKIRRQNGWESLHRAADPGLTSGIS